MGRKDPRVDAYIAKAQPFARPILTHIRKTVHAACPDVEETMKWSFPHFDYKGMLCSMASFKAHCAFGFWKAALLKDSGIPAKSAEAMGQFGRITSVSELPSEKVLAALIKKAASLNDDGVKAPRRKHAPKEPIEVPDDPSAALKKNKKALAAVRRLPSEPSTGIPRVDRRGEDRRDAPAADRHGDRVDGGRQVAKLEV